MTSEPASGVEPGPGAALPASEAAAVSDVGTDTGVDAAGASSVSPAGAAHTANAAWEALLAAHATLMRQFAAGDMWREASLREYDVLYTLSKCAKPVRQSELEAHVLLSQPAISRLVDRLVARQLVAKQADPADGRAVLLVLTESGRALQRQIGARHARDVARAVTSRLAPEEIAELGRLARLLSGGER